VERTLKEQGLSLEIDDRVLLDQLAEIFASSPAMEYLEVNDATAA
jgi:hypothetical protein